MKLRKIGVFGEKNEYKKVYKSSYNKFTAKMFTYKCHKIQNKRIKIKNFLAEFDRTNAEKIA